MSEAAGAISGERPRHIAVLGAGNIGRTLGGAWLRAGHSVTFGVRDLSGSAARETRSSLGEATRVETMADALQGADVAVLAVLGAAVDELLSAHASAMQTVEVVVDAANRGFGGQGPMNSADAIRAALPRVAIVRAFNSLGWENFARPDFDGTVADLFYCADASAVGIAARLISDIGLRPVHVGDLNRVVTVDSLAALWGALAMGQGLGRHLAFKLLTSSCPCETQNVLRRRSRRWSTSSRVAEGDAPAACSRSTTTGPFACE